MMRRLGWAPADELERLEAELIEAKAAGPLVASGPAFGSGSPSLSRASEQSERYRGWVYASVRAIADRTAGRPVRVARKARGRKPEGGRKEFDTAPGFVKSMNVGLDVIESHPLLDAIQDPNELLVGWSLMYVTSAMLELNGLAYWWLTATPDGKPQIWPLPAAWVRPIHGERLFASYEVRPANTGAEFTVHGDDMVRFAFPDPRDPIFGVSSPLQAQALAVDADEHLQRSQSAAFVNGINPGVVLRAGPAVTNGGVGMTGVPMQKAALTAEQRQTLIRAIKNAYRGVHRNGEPIILDGLIEDVFRITNTPREMDYLKSGQSTKARITQGFGVNPIILGEIEGANRASSVEAERHLCGVINPKLALMSQCITQWLGPRFGPDLVVWIEELRPNDPESERADMALLASHRAVTVNELRAWKGLPPIKGGDVLPEAKGGASGRRRSNPFRDYED